jgi:replicative DNA helicase
MSVESFVISGMVEQGTPKAAFQAGLSSDDFEIYEDEWRWIVERAERKRPINQRVFRKSFPDFEWVVSTERLHDLIEEFKQERAYYSVSSVIEKVSTDLTPDNVIEQAELMREVIAEVLRIHSPASDILLTSNWREHLQRIRQLRILREQGVAPGISTGFKNLDHHWGGLLPGRLIVALGRPGDAKSFLLTKFLIEAFKQEHRVAMFSPEMNEDEHRARIATLLSADPEIQTDFGIRKAFRNRALMEGSGFNEKTYKRFWQYLESLPGEMCLLTQKWRRTKMTPAYIESRVDDLGIELAIIDPIYKLKPNQRRQLKHEEIADMVDAVQDLSTGFNIPVVISNQANRQIGNRGDAPSQEASFGSDAPAQEAAHVIGVKHFSEERKMVLRCSKNRFGADFRFDVAFHPNIGRMVDITPIRGDYYNGRDDLDAETLKEYVKEVEEEREAVEVD